MINGVGVAVDAISKCFGPVQALSEVSLQIEPGEIHALLGENGAGKSTLVRLLAGQQRPDSGRILLDGEVVDVASPTRARELGIGVVHQELSLFPNLSVAENLFADALPKARFGMLSRGRLRADAAKLLERFELQDQLDRPVGQLTVARRQVVEIVKTQARACRLLIFDEPTSALSQEETDRLFDLIAELRSEGVTIVYITHKLHEVMRLADRASVLRDGKAVGTVNVRDTTADALVAMMVGREIKSLFEADEAREAGEPVLEVRGLTCGSRVRDVDLVVRAGEIVGLAGVVGAGRTETVRAIFGIDRRTAGSVSVDGHALPSGRPYTAIAHGMGLVPEDRKTAGLFLEMSVSDNIIAANLDRHYRRGLRRAGDERAAAARMIDQLRIKTPGPDQIVGRLSGGNQQKVLLARWLVERPKILLVDEPTRGIDVGARAEIYQILRDLASDGVGVLMVSSELPELLGMCDRLLVMHEGRIAAELVGEEATEQAVVTVATGGILSIQGKAA